MPTGTAVSSGDLLASEFMQPSHVNASMLAAELGMSEDLINDLIYGRTLSDVGMGV